MPGILEINDFKSLKEEFRLDSGKIKLKNNKKFNGFSYKVNLINNENIFQRKINNISILFFNSNIEKDPNIILKNKEKLNDKDIKIDIDKKIYNISLTNFNDKEYKDTLELIFLNNMYKIGYDIKYEYLNIFSIYGSDVDIYIDFDVKLRSIYFK